MRKRPKELVSSKKIDKVKWEDDTQNKYYITVPMLIKIWKRYNEKDVGEIFDDDLEPLLPHIDKTQKIPRNKKFRKLMGKKYLSLIEKNNLNTASVGNNNDDKKILGSDDELDNDKDEDKHNLITIKAFLSRFRGKTLSLIVLLTF